MDHLVVCRDGCRCYRPCRHSWSSSLLLLLLAAAAAACSAVRSVRLRRRTDRWNNISVWRESPNWWSIPTSKLPLLLEIFTCEATQILVNTGVESIHCLPTPHPSSIASLTLMHARPQWYFLRLLETTPPTPISVSVDREDHGAGRFPSLSLSHSTLSLCECASVCVMERLRGEVEYVCRTGVYYFEPTGWKTRWWCNRGAKVDRWCWWAMKPFECLNIDSSEFKMHWWIRYILPSSFEWSSRRPPCHRLRHHPLNAPTLSSPAVKFISHYSLTFFVYTSQFKQAITTL